MATHCAAARDGTVRRTGGLGEEEERQLPIQVVGRSDLFGGKADIIGSL